MLEQFLGLLEPVLFLLQRVNCFAPTDYWSFCLAFVADFIFATIGMGKASTVKKKLQPERVGKSLDWRGKKLQPRARERMMPGHVDIATSVLRRRRLVAATAEASDVLRDSPVPTCWRLGAATASAGSGEARCCEDGEPAGLRSQRQGRPWRAA